MKNNIHRKSFIRGICPRCYEHSYGIFCSDCYSALKKIAAKKCIKYSELMKTEYIEVYNTYKDLWEL